MKAKKLFALLLAAAFVLSAAFPVFAEGDKAGRGAIDTVASDGKDYNHMSMEELYELAKQETGVIEVYATTADANTAVKKFKKAFPDLKDRIEYISCDTDTITAKIEMEADSGNVNADVMMVKDNSGEIFNEMFLYDYVSIYYPAKVCDHISDEMLQYGLPLYATFNPWFYNTAMYPDGIPVESWWDIVEGYNTDTCSFIDAAGKNTQKWSIYTKDIKGPSYSSLWAQLIVDGDLLAKQYEEQFGEPLTYTYNDKLNNWPGVMELPENNGGVELFWRFTQMQMTELDDGDGVVDAVDQSLNGPTLGLTSASKLDNADQGLNIAWVTGLKPYTAFQGSNYTYVVEGCDNPAGARLYILFCMGGDDGVSGCYESFDKRGAWSVRDDVEFKKSGITADEVGLTPPDFAQIYVTYPNVVAYWTYWRSLKK